MLQSGNIALAAALATGQKRYFRYKLMFDWARNGLFADANSDLSGCFVEGSRDKQLVGDFPARMQIQAGHASAQLTVTLAGNAPGGLPVWQLISPTAAAQYAYAASLNVPMYFSVLVWVPQSVSWLELKQFTGYVRSAVPTEVNGQVQITCLDEASQLEQPITCYRWAVDYYMRTKAQPPGSVAAIENLENDCITADWLIDHILRRTGHYEAPAFHPNTVLGWTLRGAVLPEIGAINQDCTRNWNALNPQANSAGNPKNCAQRTPAGMPSQIFDLNGQYGAAFKGSGKIGLYNGNRVIRDISGVAYSTQLLPVRTYGGNNSNLFTFSCWVKVDATLADQFSVAQFILDYVATSGTKPYVVNAQINQVTGACQLSVNQFNGTISWTWNATTNLTAGWHFVQMTARFTSTNIFGYILSDGVNIITPGGNGGNSAPLPAAPSSYPGGATHAAWIEAVGPMQVAAWNYQHDTPIGSFTWAPSTPPTDPRQRAKVDIGYQRYQWLPDISQTPAWDVLSSIQNSDFGALYVTEDGTPTYDARSTIKARRLIANVVLTLTRDDFYDLNPEASFDTIATIVNWTENVKWSDTTLTAWSEARPDDYQIPASTNLTYNVTLADVQAINTGNVPWAYRAQGYDPSGTKPSYWQNVMQFYSPDFYAEGFTAYTPNSRPISDAPPQATGLDVQPQPGWATGDLDPRHLRLFMSNGSGGLLEYAVDDSRAFLKVGGTLLFDRPQVTGSVQDNTAITSFGKRPYVIPATDYTQDHMALSALAPDLLADLKTPQIYLASVPLVGDPRRQLQDVYKVGDPLGYQTMYGMVVGIGNTYSGGDNPKITDTVTLRTF